VQHHQTIQARRAAHVFYNRGLQQLFPCWDLQYTFTHNSTAIILIQHSHVLATTIRHTYSAFVRQSMFPRRKHMAFWPQISGLRPANSSINSTDIGAGPLQIWLSCDRISNASMHQQYNASNQIHCRLVEHTTALRHPPQPQPWPPVDPEMINGSSAQL
jgi:hypothetical protein